MAHNDIPRCGDAKRIYGSSRHLCVLPPGHSYEHTCACGECWTDE